MSPFRWDVLLVGFVLALPVLALGLRGDLTTEEMMTRLPWCLGAGWGAVALLRYAVTPRTPVKSARPAGRATITMRAAPTGDDEDATRD
jgi:hypothetical protein